MKKIKFAAWLLIGGLSASAFAASNHTGKDENPTSNEYTLDNMLMRYNAAKTLKNPVRRAKELEYVEGMSHCKQISNFAKWSGAGAMDVDKFVRYCFAYEHMQLSLAEHPRTEDKES